jgi:DNA-binding NarL/FixJ family response regulator
MLIAAGRANREIAVELGIGVRTVKGHVAVILRAMHVDDRRAARLRARRWLARRDRNIDRHAGVPASG